MAYESSTETHNEMCDAGREAGAAMAQAFIDKMPQLDTDEGIERARVLIFKSMNEWAEKLRAGGVAEIDVQSGRLACATEYQIRVAEHLANLQAQKSELVPPVRNELAIRNGFDVHDDDVFVF